MDTYDAVRYSKILVVCEKNKSEVLERMKKIDVYLQSADASNRKGVAYFEEKSYDKAKDEFENAVKHMHEIRILVPKYSAGSYEGLLRIYSENLRRAEDRL